MERLIQDIRYSIRVLLKSPVFSAVAVLSLALGIGANTTIFTVINAIFLNPLPVKDISELVQLGTTDENNPSIGFAVNPVSFPNYEDFRDQNDVFSGLTSTGFAQLTLSGEQREPLQVLGFLVTANYFEVMGVQPLHGRTFFPEEDKHPGGDLVAVLSYSFWAGEFGADPGIVGKDIILNSQPFTVIGVAPPGFKGPFSLVNPDAIWVPISMHEQLLPGDFAQFFLLRRGLFTLVHGRLKPGVSIEQAESAMKTIAARLEQEYPEANKGRSVKLSSLRDAALVIPPEQAKLADGLLMAVVGMVLLIACVNLANLLLARGSIREKEMSIRAAMGAGRSLLMRQLLTESIVLSLVGGAAGLLLAFWARDLLWLFRPPFLNENALELSLDLRVLLFTLGVSLATGVLFGLIPAIKTSDPDLISTLKVGGRGNSGGISGNRLRSALVVAEVALAVVALIGAGLFIRSMQAAQQMDPGFESEKLFVIGMDLGSRNYETERGLQFYREVTDAALSAPGVETAAVSSSIPLGFGTFQRSVFPEGTSPEVGDKGILVHTHRMGTRYFDTMRIPLVKGRLPDDFDREDTQKVAVVNEAMAARFWPNQEAVGNNFFSLARPTNGGKSSAWCATLLFRRLAKIPRRRFICRSGRITLPRESST